MHTVRREFWQLPELTSINRLSMTSCLVPFPSPEAALGYDRFTSEWVQRLNGTWQFRLLPSPDSVPESAITGPAAGSPEGFRAIDVPGNWTLQDTGDLPIYTNVQMPFDNRPPVVPADNPTGVYRRAFRLPEAWSGRRVLIHIGGVESYYELFVNGALVGVAKDTRLPSEFDITAYLRTGGSGYTGENELALKVVRWSDSSYIEDQDQWWMAGIYRDVYLVSTEAALVEDIFARADYDPATRVGHLHVTASFNYRPHAGNDPRATTGPIEPYRLEASLYDSAGARVWEATTRVDPSFRVREYREELRAELPGVSPWSSESPTLYRLVVTLIEPDADGGGGGRHIESRCVRVGFRRVRIEDRKLLINGKPVLIRGVNRHEHDERLGKVMTRDLMLTDIRTLKSFNFNAVRTSHYPNTMEWYDLCDEYGIYLVDEADVEAHANYATLCRDPRWARAFEERIMRMVVRDKNHPSVIAWSAGNESGHGENHARALELVRRYDPSRVLHHEGEVKRLWGQGGTAPANVYTDGCNRSNDLVNPMYPTIESIITHAVESRDPRPVILCEYSHAMGNSNGSLAEYFDAFERYDGLQGGFIWEWVDHGIRRTDEQGRDYWAYGGDFGETVHDSNFVADGLVWPDRTPHPAMYEFKKLAQPVAVEAVSLREGRFTIRSKQDFVSLDWLEGAWVLEHEGVPVDSGSLPPLDVPPGGKLPVTIRFAGPGLLDHPEAHLRFDFRSRRATPWCEAGHPVAWEQFAVSAVAPRPPAAPERPTSPAQGGGASVPTASPAPGAFARLVTGPRLNLFRATTDNDGIRGWSNQEAKPMGLWLAAGYHALTLRSRRVEERSDAAGPTMVEHTEYVGTDPNAVIAFSVSASELGPDTVRYALSLDVPPELPTLPRVGVVMETIPGFESLRWFGRGPQENHIDRRAGYPVGLYEGTVADQYVPYIMPQENGSKCDVRWFELSDGRHVLRFVAEPLFEFSAHHFTAEDLFACRHTNELADRLRPQTVVSIDLRQRGVGTGSCGPQTREPYCIPPGRYEWSFLVQIREA
jgi:beta-galactosidase